MTSHLKTLNYVIDFTKLRFAKVISRRLRLMKLSWATSFSVPSFLALIFGTGANLLCLTGHCLRVDSLKPLGLNHVIPSARVIKSKVSNSWGEGSA